MPQNSKGVRRQINVRLPVDLVERIDAHRGDQSRDDWFIAAAAQRLDRRRPPDPQPLPPTVKSVAEPERVRFTKRAAVALDIPPEVLEPAVTEVKPPARCDHKRSEDFGDWKVIERRGGLIRWSFPCVKCGTLMQESQLHQERGMRG